MRKQRAYLQGVKILCALAGALALAPQAHPAVPRALSPGQLPADRRLEPPKDLDGYFPFTPPASLQDWEKRAPEVRRQLQVALGLWPMPERTPLNPVVHGAMDRGDYIVEKVFFESAPGFFVTGNLYRPKKATGPMPGILCPHGHWTDGRFMDHGEEEVRRQIVNGAERFEEGGRSVLQARCVQLARMGCLVFLYDMIGYADSVQIPLSIAHGFAKQRPEMNTPENWGLFSPQAESHLQSVMMLQTWNSIRALDFIMGIPGVDQERIACTGASGGGTQTFILAALDPRVRFAFPAVMVGTAMQGGCTCENASLLRVDTGNVEIAALIAPRPLGMTTADDWTREMSVKGFPELQKLYGLYGAQNLVSLKRAEHFGHNYNYVSRAAMYSFMNAKLGLGLKEPVVEQDYKRLTREEMSVWDATHPAPASNPDVERKIVATFQRDSEKQLAGSSMNLASFKALTVPALQVVVGRTLEKVGPVEWKLTVKTDHDSWLEMAGTLRNKNHGEEVPVVFLYPKKTASHTVLWLTENGKDGLYGADGNPLPEVRQLLAIGATVVGLDLLYQGEFLAEGKPLTETPRVKNPREAAAYTLGYNRAVAAGRAQDILTAAAFIRSHENRPERLDLVALDGTALIAAAALSVSEGAFHHAALGTRGTRFGMIADVRSPFLLPGGAKYGDVPGMLAVSGVKALWQAGETETRKTPVGLSGAVVTDAPGAASAADAVSWLLQKN